MQLGLIDIYGIYNHCDLETDGEQRRRFGKSKVVTPRSYILSELLRTRGADPKGVHAASTVHDLNGCWGLCKQQQQQQHASGRPSLLLTTARCFRADDATTAYLNRDATRIAIHVRTNHEEQLAYGPETPGWGLCGMRGVRCKIVVPLSRLITLTDSLTRRCLSLDDRGETADLLPMYPSLVEQLRILIFSGDADACVPYIGSEIWTSELAEANGWEIAEPWHPWVVDQQVGGYATVYSGPHDFTFATVFNAGHMVPEDKPVEALALFKRFTYPEAGGRVDWNPAPEIALHIASQEPAPADAEDPFALATTATASLGESFTAAVSAAGGYANSTAGPVLYFYQWSKDGLPLTEFGPTLTLPVRRPLRCG